MGIGLEMLSTWSFVLVDKMEIMTLILIFTYILIINRVCRLYYIEQPMGLLSIRCLLNGWPIYNHYLISKQVIGHWSYVWENRIGWLFVVFVRENGTLNYIGRVSYILPLMSHSETDLEHRWLGSRLGLLRCLIMLVFIDIFKKEWQKGNTYNWSGDETWQRQLQSRKRRWRGDEETAGWSIGEI